MEKHLLLFYKISNPNQTQNQGLGLTSPSTPYTPPSVHQTHSNPFYPLSKKN